MLNIYSTQYQISGLELSGFRVFRAMSHIGAKVSAKSRKKSIPVYARPGVPGDLSSSPADGALYMGSEIQPDAERGRLTNGLLEPVLQSRMTTLSRR